MSRSSHPRAIVRRTLLAAFGVLATASLGLPLVAAAQTFPSRPITIVVPYPPGGTTDVLARVMQEPLQKLLGQPVLIDNRPGASGTLGTRMVARAPADGHTLLFPNNGLVIAPHVSKEAGYAPLTDFAPVSLVSLQPMVLVVNPATPAKNVRELLDHAKANPGKVNYASAGPASFGHLSTLLLARSAGASMTHIPYKGQAPTTQAVLTGEVQMLLTTTSSQMTGFIKEGKLRLLAVSSEQASPLVPGAAPIAQTVPGFSAEVWFGLLAPAGTPRETVGRLNEAIGKVLAMPDVRAKFEGAGGLAVGSTPEQLASRIATEYNNWAVIVKDANIKAE